MINYIIVFCLGFIFSFLFIFMFLIKDFKKIKEVLKDALYLSKVLTTNQNLKGKFGENCLEAVIKVCYPDENINYIKQFYSSNIDNKEIKPDYLINLPDGKSILIDCKLNLEKFISYNENKNKKNKSELIKDINNTINNLSNKKYETAKNLIQPDFVLMYIPLEPLISLIYTDNDFRNVIKNANDKNIIIVGNSSILTTIRLVNLIWTQNRQENNLDKIINSAQNIYDCAIEHSNNLLNIKNTFDECAKRIDREYEKIKLDGKFFKIIDNLRDYGLKPYYKKSNKKDDTSVI